MLLDHLGFQGFRPPSTLSHIIYLGSLVLRALAVFVAASTALKRKNTAVCVLDQNIRRELLHRCVLLLQGKLIGGIVGPIQPFLIGLLLGPRLSVPMMRWSGFPGYPRSSSAF